MGRRNKKRISYKRLRENRSSNRDNVETKRLEKLERANHRRKLKICIELSLKKLRRILNLTYQYLGE
jgi:hypothetical protein